VKFVWKLRDFKVTYSRCQTIGLPGWLSRKTDCRLHDWGSFRSRGKNFRSSLCDQTDFRAHQVSCPLGTGSPFGGGGGGGKARPGRDADFSPPCSADGQEQVGAIPPPPPRPRAFVSCRGTALRYGQVPAEPRTVIDFTCFHINMLFTVTEVTELTT
jgi:hypothetical protein